ncbi:MAG: hypothetical protein IJS52_10560 [Bacilli bacterium]|nr:hypothetical protein [Bacilli bacterium]
MSYTLNDFMREPAYSRISCDYTIRIMRRDGKRRNVTVTDENLAWCLKHFGEYEIKQGGVYPFCHACDLHEDGIGMPSADFHLSIAIELDKPEEKEGEGEDDEGAD